jgi:hypothetical protein
VLKAGLWPLRENSGLVEAGPSLASAPVAAAVPRQDSSRTRTEED